MLTVMGPVLAIPTQVSHHDTQAMIIAICIITRSRTRTATAADDVSKIEYRIRIPSAFYPTFPRQRGNESPTAMTSGNCNCKAVDRNRQQANTPGTHASRLFGIKKNEGSNIKESCALGEVDGAFGWPCDGDSGGDEASSSSAAAADLPSRPLHSRDEARPVAKQ